MSEMNRLKSNVLSFRKGILGKKSSHKMCFAVCAPLQGFLELMGYQVELVEGEYQNTNHYWLQLPDGNIIDPTADQFQTPTGEPMPKVYIGKKPEWYK